MGRPDGESFYQPLTEYTKLIKKNYDQFLIREGVGALVSKLNLNNCVHTCDKEPCPNIGRENVVFQIPALNHKTFFTT